MVSKADEVLKAIERRAWSYYYPIIRPDKGQILVDVIREIQPKRILEVGTLVGYSTLILARELDSTAEIITLEIDGDEAEVAEENIRRAEVQPNVRVVVEDALDMIPKLDGGFDLVFIDADKSEYFDYLQLIEDNLHAASLSRISRTSQRIPYGDMWIMCEALASMKATQWRSIGARWTLA